MPVITFAEALRETSETKRHLLLGNGFSIALFQDRFRYQALFDAADFADLPQARQAFEALDTTDFEIVIRALKSMISLFPLYANFPDIQAQMHRDAEAIKELLVETIANRHPDRPSAITDEQYQASIQFLSNFIGASRNLKSQNPPAKDLRGYIYTLNYDLMLYWVLMHGRDASTPANIRFEPDDGFRAEEAPDAAYVTWQAEGAADGQNIHYLHGSLHLFDRGAELDKYCWERSGGIPLIDQTRAALDEERYPLFVSGGDSEDKLTRIRHSGYLQRSLKSFAAVSRPQSDSTSLFIFGHSLADNDDHILRHLTAGKIKNVYVSLFGSIDTSYNQEIIAKAARMVRERGERFPLVIKFYDAESANIWGANT